MIDQLFSVVAGLDEQRDFIKLAENNGGSYTWGIEFYSPFAHVKMRFTIETFDKKYDEVISISCRELQQAVGLRNFLATVVRDRLRRMMRDIREHENKPCNVDATR